MAKFQDLIQRGTRAAQPVATAVPVGTLYFVTDENVTERSNAATWQAYSSASPGAILLAATVATAETQASAAAYGDLATAGPAVTITMAGTVAVVWLSGLARRNATGNTAFIGVAVSGASTVAASDAQAATAPSYAANINSTLSRSITLTGLTPGVNVFTAKYHNDGSGVNTTFENRGIAVFAP